MALCAPASPPVARLDVHGAKLLASALAPSAAGSSKRRLANNPAVHICIYI